MKMKELNKLKKMMAAAKKEMQKKGQEAIKDAFKEMFDAVPELEAFKFKGIVPYFNDGNACIYRVEDASFKFSGQDEIGDDEDGFVDQYDFYEDKKNPLAKHCETLSEMFDDIRDNDIFETVFGSHAEVFVYPDHIDVEEYTDHD